MLLCTIHCLGFFVPAIIPPVSARTVTHNALMSIEPKRALTGAERGKRWRERLSTEGVPTHVQFDLMGCVPR
jgi:hypothetical protein